MKIVKLFGLFLVLMFFSNKSYSCEWVNQYLYNYVDDTQFESCYEAINAPNRTGAWACNVIFQTVDRVAQQKCLPDDGSPPPECQPTDSWDNPSQSCVPAGSCPIGSLKFNGVCVTLVDCDNGRSVPNFSGDATISCDVPDTCPSNQHYYYGECIGEDTAPVSPDGPDPEPDPFLPPPVTSTSDEVIDSTSTETTTTTTVTSTSTDSGTGETTTTTTETKSTVSNTQSQSEKTEQEEVAKNATASANCNQKPICDGDPIECEILYQIWWTHCETETENQMPEFSEGNYDNIEDSTSSFSDRIANAPVSQAFSNFANIVNLSNAACPEFAIDLTSTLGVTLSTQIHCTLLGQISTILGPIMLVIYSFFGFRIFASA